MSVGIAKASDVLVRFVLCSRLEVLEDGILAGERFCSETSVRQYVDREHIGVHRFENLKRVTI